MPHGTRVTEHIYYIAFGKNAGLLEQKAHGKRVARKSHESMAGSSLSFKNVVAELVQAEVNFCFSANVSHSCIRSIELEYRENDSATRCNFERLRFQPFINHYPSSVAHSHFD